MEFSMQKLTRPFQLDLNMPGSKSITIRDLALAALAEGASTIRSPGICDDTTRMTDAVRKLGVRIDESSDDVLVVHGTGGRFSAGPVNLDIGQSAASTRTLLALCALRAGPTMLDGHESMRVRPNKYLLDALQQLCADITSTGDGYLPVTVAGQQQRIASITMKGDKSSQYFSALLQIAPLLAQGLQIAVDGELVSKPYIDITIDEMAKFGVQVTNDDYQSLSVRPQTYHPVDIVVEGDASAASYFSALATIHGGRVTIGNLGSSTRQGDYGFLEVCERLGATVTRTDTTTTIVGPKDGKLLPLVNPLNMEMMPGKSVV